MVFLLIFLPIILGFLGRLFHRILSPKPIPKFDPNQYWGPGKPPEKLDSSIKEFKINVPEKVR